MTCASCASRIEKKLNRLDGVEATVNYATEEATVAFDPTRVERRRPDRGGRGRRLPRRAPRRGARGRRPDARAPARRLVVAAALDRAARRCSRWSRRSSSTAGSGSRSRSSTPVVLWAGWPFHRAALANARHGAATMDTLISIGTLAAWTWSAVVLARRHRRATPTSRSARVITTLILLGRYLEARARRRSGEAIRALLELGAKEARVLRDGDEVLVPVERARGRRPVRRPARARRSRPTASSTRASRRSTSRC